MKEKLIKIAITNKGNNALERMLESLNNDSHTKVKKQALLSWLVIQYEKKFFKIDRKRMIKETQSPLAYAKSLLKELEKNNKNIGFKDIQSFFKK